MGGVECLLRVFIEDGSRFAVAGGRAWLPCPGLLDDRFPKDVNRESRGASIAMGVVSNAENRALHRSMARLARCKFLTNSVLVPRSSFTCCRSRPRSPRIRRQSCSCRSAVSSKNFVVSEAVPEAGGAVEGSGGACVSSNFCWSRDSSRFNSTMRLHRSRILPMASVCQATRFCFFVSRVSTRSCNPMLRFHTCRSHPIRFLTRSGQPKSSLPRAARMVSAWHSIQFSTSVGGGGDAALSPIPAEASSGSDVGI